MVAENGPPPPPPPPPLPGGPLPRSSSLLRDKGFNVPNFRQAAERIVSQRNEVAQSKKTTSSELDAAEASDSRKFITRIVLWTWALSMAVYATMAAFQSVGAAGVLEIIKIAVLPLTTLVLGYYLSRAR